MLYDHNSTLLVCLALSHTHDRHTQRHALPDLHRGWSHRAKTGDKKQLSIENSQSGYKDTNNSPANDWEERQLDPGNHLWSRKEKKGGHLQQLQQFLSLSGGYRRISSREREGKNHNIEVNCLVHQKVQQHFVFIYSVTNRVTETHIIILWTVPSRNNL